jgi:mannose-6-phosphate isomerase-like protein (cupin superfamily)
MNNRECDSLSAMVNVKSRRNFLRSAPLVAAAVSPLAESLLHASTAQSEAAAPTVPIQLFTADEMAANLKEVQTGHSSKTLLSPKGIAFTMVINEESDKVAKEFEYHAKRDHIFQVLAGETQYELGGKPKDPRETKPGEFLAPASEGFKTVVLKHGDYLLVPRMTPHRRITDGSVSLLLISAEAQS